VRFLLDTHAFIWWAEDNPLLSTRAHATISSETNEPLLSVASAWEIAIKVGAGKLRVSGTLQDWLRDEMRESRIAALEITLAHTFAVAELPRHHRDPFDRLLVAQARSENLPLLTNDDMLKRYGIRTIW